MTLAGLISTFGAFDFVAAVLGLIAVAIAARGALTLEAMLTGVGLADLPASPLQRAICRVIEGRGVGDLLPPAEVERFFGVAPAALEGLRPRVIVLVCGIRGGKSFLAACAAIHAALTADLSQLKRHELPRFPIVGPTTDAARATFVILIGILRGSKALARFIETETADSVVLRRDDGWRGEIVVVPANRGGLSFRNRWLFGFALEEVSQMSSEVLGAIVNAEEMLRAGETRLLPGCRGWVISSPHGPVGLLHDLWRRYFGRPGRVLVVHAPTRAMNPSFPQAEIDAVAAESPDLAAREFEATWLDAESAFLPGAIVDPAVRETPLIRPCPRHVQCAAGMDPGTRSNDWTLAVAWGERLDPKRFRVVVGGAWRWQGSKASPLSPAATLREIAEILQPYGDKARFIGVDSWSFDAMQDHARAVGLELQELAAGQRNDPWTRLRNALANGLVELPPEPLVRSDLLAVRQRATPGGMRIDLPRTPDGRHADFAPAIAIAVDRVVRGWGAPRAFQVNGRDLPPA